MFKKVLLGLFFLGFALFIVALFLPKQWTVEESITIEREPAIVYPFIANLSAWEKWSAWTKEDYDPTITYRYEGVEGQVGSKQYWQGQRGTGILTLTQLIPDRFVQYHMEMTQYDFNTSLALVPEGNITKVVWTCYGDSGKNPMTKSMQLIFIPMIKEDFQKGLAKLKAQIEQKP